MELVLVDSRKSWAGASDLRGIGAEASDRNIQGAGVADVRGVQDQFGAQPVLPRLDWWEMPCGRQSPPLTMIAPMGCRKRAKELVALNWGMGSSSLNAEVKALLKLHVVRGSNSGYFGRK